MGLARADDDTNVRDDDANVRAENVSTTVGNADVPIMYHTDLGR